MISIFSRNWVLSNIETVLFDKDGTLIDLHYFWGKMTEMRAMEVIRRFSIDKKQFETICEFLGYNTKTGKMYPNGITALYSRVKIIEIFKENLKEIGISTTKEEITQIFDDVAEEFYKEAEKYTLLIKDAFKFAVDLHSKGIKIGIVTSDSGEATKLTLKKLGLEGLFDVIIGRESSTETKESGALTKIALKELGADPTTTLMIGDAPMDAISAQNAGIEKTNLVATGQVEANELENYSLYVVNSFRKLNCLKI